MVRDAEGTAHNAEQSTWNNPGYCLQWSRERADVSAYYNDASTAWRNTNDRHPGDRSKIPRGAMVYWTGGSQGYGHIAVSLGGGQIRSSDAGGSGKPATRSLDWFDTHWPSLDYAGWAWDVNEVTIPHDTSGGDEMNDADWDKLRSIVADEVEKAWDKKMTVTKKSGEQQNLAREQVIKETYQKVQREL